MKDKDTVSPKPDWERWIERRAFKSHPLNTYNDAVSASDADDFCQEIWDLYVRPLQSRITELESQMYISERFRMKDAMSAINEANGLRSHIADLEKENQELKHALKQFKDAR